MKDAPDRREIDFRGVVVFLKQAMQRGQGGGAAPAETIAGAGTLRTPNAVRAE
jgi:hypothetical protein